MNRLKYLREKSNLSLRQLSKETEMSGSLISLLENGKRTWRLPHINALCDFFKVSADFMLGKSDYGIFVELSRRNDFAAISKEEYEKYLLDGSIKEYIEFNSVWRIPSDELEEKLDPAITSNIKKEIIEEVNNLSKNKLEKLLNFIREYLK